MMHSLNLALLIGLLLSDVSLATSHNDLLLKGANSSSAYYGNFSSKAVNASHVSHDSLPLKAINSSSDATRAGNTTSHDTDP